MIISFEVVWKGAQGIERLKLHAPADSEGRLSLTKALAQLPLGLQNKVAAGQLKVAVWGEFAKAHRCLANEDRLELLGPIELDVRSSRMARVKALRAQKRSLTNRAHQGKF